MKPRKQDNYEKNTMGLYRFGFWTMFVAVMSFALSVYILNYQFLEQPSCPIATQHSGTFCSNYADVKAWCGDSCSSHFPDGYLGVKLYMNSPTVMVCSCLTGMEGMTENYSPTETIFC